MVARLEDIVRSAAALLGYSLKVEQEQDLFYEG